MYDFHSPKQKPRLENRRRNQDPRTSYRSTRTCSRPDLNGSTPRPMRLPKLCQIRAFRKVEAYRAGHYDRSLIAKVSRLGLKVSESKVHLDWDRHNHYQSSWCFSSRLGSPRKRHHPSLHNKNPCDCQPQIARIFYIKSAIFFFRVYREYW